MRMASSSSFLSGWGPLPLGLRAGKGLFPCLSCSFLLRLGQEEQAGFGGSHWWAEGILGGAWIGPCACDSKPPLLPGKRLRRVRAEMEQMAAFLPAPETVWGLDSSHTCCCRLFQRLLHWADGLNHGRPLSWLSSCPSAGIGVAFEGEGLGKT